MSVNQCTFIGNVGRDPEIKSLTDNKVASFSIGQTEIQKGEKVTIWHDIKCWGKIAEVIEKYVKKGDKIYISGRLGYEHWEKDGVKHTRAVITAGSIELLGNSKASTDSQQSQQPAQQSEQVPPAGEDGDDLPF